MSFKDQIVWITGASSGIGEALAYAFVDEGARVILSARRKEELERVKTACGDKAERCIVIPLDLTDADSLQRASQTVFEKVGRVDVLVNNGGISQRSLVHETDLSVDRRLMEINYFGHVTLTKLLLPQMIQQGGAHIVVLSSLTGKFGFPLRSAYAATKHALHGFFDTLGLELFDKKVFVTLVCPGRINTPISMSALTKDGTPHAQMDPGQANGIPAEDCAQQILAAVRKRKKEIYIGSLKEVAAVYLKRFLPSVLFNMARKESAV